MIKKFSTVAIVAIFALLFQLGATRTSLAAETLDSPNDQVNSTSTMENEIMSNREEVDNEALDKNDEQEVNDSKENVTEKKYSQNDDEPHSAEASQDKEENDDNEGWFGNERNDKKFVGKERGGEMEYGDHEGDDIEGILAVIGTGLGGLLLGFLIGRYKIDFSFIKKRERSTSIENKKE